jgi:hypothetical protein
MTRLLLRYREYRQLGFNRIDAFHFAWLVVMAGALPVSIRNLTRR